MKKIINEKNTSIIIEVLSVGLLIFLGYILFLNNSYGLKTFNNGDVQRGFKRGIDVINGVNSYLEFNPDQMLIQEKVPGFFPLYFYLMALIAKISNHSFVLFLDNLRYLVFFSYVSIGVIIYAQLRKQSKLLGLAAMFIFMFNRWTLGDVYSLKQDSYVILITLISMLLLKKNKPLSFLLFGIATGIKHLTFFVFPIFIFKVLEPLYEKRSNWKSKEYAKEIGRAFLYISLMLLPILGPSIPYIIETPRHYAGAILYNLTREAESSSGNLDAGFDRLLVRYNQDTNNNIFFYILPRAPMLLAFILLTATLFIKKIDIWKYAAFSFLIFIAFNPVVFGQYYTWFMAFIPFALVSNHNELIKKNHENSDI